MNKLITLILMFFSVLIISSTLVFACKMMPYSIQLNDGDKNCIIFPINSENGANITFVENSNIDKFCSTFSLTDEDKMIIINSLEKLKTDYRYTHIVKQTDERYSEFQNEMKKINSAPCDCSKIIFRKP